MSANIIVLLESGIPMYSLVIFIVIIEHRSMIHHRMGLGTQ